MNTRKEPRLIIRKDLKGPNLMTTCAIIQSSYIPWRGHFDIIHQSDVFIFLDSVQFTRRDWRTRNFIKAAPSLINLSVPVNVSNHFNVPIFDVQIDKTSNWAKKHLRSIESAYSHAPFKDLVLEAIRPVYMNPPTKLIDLNRSLTKICWNLLTANAPKSFVGDETVTIADFSSATDRIVKLCQAVGATKYLSGPSAAYYMDESLFHKNGIALEYVKYNYTAYPQLHGAFRGDVSILDVLFNLGPNSYEQAFTKTPAAEKKQAA